MGMKIKSVLSFSINYLSFCMIDFCRNKKRRGKSFSEELKSTLRNTGLRKGMTFVWPDKPEKLAISSSLMNPSLLS